MSRQNYRRGLGEFEQGSWSHRELAGLWPSNYVAKRSGPVRRLSKEEIRQLNHERIMEEFAHEVEEGKIR